MLRAPRNIESLRSRIWLPVIGVSLAAVGGVQVSRGGLHGLEMVIGILVGVALFAAAFKLPAIAPFTVIALATMDKQISFANLQLTTTVLALILFAPIFLHASVTSRAIPRFAKAGTGLLVTGLLIACFTAGHLDAALVGTIRWILVLNMVLGVAAMCAKDSALTRGLATAIVIAGAIASVFGIMQREGVYFLVGSPYATDVFDSTFGYYTNFANFEAIAVVIGVGLVIDSARGSRRVLAIVATALCLYGVSAALSRGAVLLVAVGLFFLLLKHSAKPGRIVGVSIVGAIVGWIVWTLLPKVDLDRFIARFNGRQGGDLLRLRLQDGGLDLLGHSPLGIGFDNFRSFIESGFISASQALAHAHNTFIQMGLDAGWLGLAGFLVLAVGAVLSAFRSKGNSLQITFGAALAGFLVQVTQDYFFFEPASLVFFGLILAGSIGATHVRGAHNRNPPACLAY